MEPYKQVVLDLLQQKQYPVLENYVFLDVYYKTIPPLTPARIRQYDRRIDQPEDVFIRDANPFDLSYLVPGGDTFYMYHVPRLDVASYPEQCLTLKLNRFVVDTRVLHRMSASFEEELYAFLALLNVDVPRVAPLLDLTFMESTRFLPQHIQLWVHQYQERTLASRPLTATERSCFGPEKEGVLSVRELSGHLAAATSHAHILSLRDGPFRYTDHYSDHWDAVFPLAFNPLENPIIDCRTH